MPERYEQMIARGAEYGNDRIIMGSHYTMDVLAGRTLALFDMAHLLANDPAYMGLPVRGVLSINDFRRALSNARAELVVILRLGCGNSIEVCAREDLPVVYPRNAEVREDVGKVAPEAGYLLAVAFPSLNLELADRILTETEGPGGGFLDDGSPFGVYSRLNLYAAAQRAAQVVASK